MSCVQYNTTSDVPFLRYRCKELYMLHSAADFCSQNVHQNHHPPCIWVIIALRRHSEHKVAEAHRQALKLLRTGAWQGSDSRGRNPQIRILPSLRCSDPLPPPLFGRPSLHLLLASLRLSLPLIKSLNWLVHTCSCTGSFGTNLHHQSRFSHQLRAHPGAHCPSLLNRASHTVCGRI